MVEEYNNSKTVAREFFLGRARFCASPSQCSNVAAAVSSFYELWLKSQV